MRAPALVLVALALLAGCSSDEPAAAGSSATHTGWLRDRSPVDAAAFLARRVEPYGGARAFVSLVVRGNEVVRISEIYLP